MHRPIMVPEILEILAPKPGDFAIDATLGYGGHTAALLDAVLPGGRVLALDVDPIELPKTAARLRALDMPPDALLIRRPHDLDVTRHFDLEILARMLLEIGDAIEIQRIDNRAIAAARVETIEVCDFAVILEHDPVGRAVSERLDDSQGTHMQRLMHGTSKRSLP